MRASFVGIIILLVTLSGIASSRAQTFTLTLQPNSVPAVTEGVPYNQAITAVGGNSDYSLVVTSGSLPPGISLTGSNGNWALTGTSNTPGTYSFRIDATDIDGNTGYRPYTMSIGAAGGITLSPGTLPNGTQSTAYSQTITASGGNGSYTFSHTGTLPNGLSLSSGGVLSGTPTVAGSFNFTVNVTDTDSNTGSQSYIVNITGNTLTLSPATLPNGALGTPYSQTVTASGGTAPYTFSLSSGSLPTGLSMDSSGNITGTPGATGSYGFTVRAQDVDGNFGTRGYTVNIGSNSLTVSPASLPSGTNGTAYNQTVTASGGTGPYTFTVSAGALPAGLALSSAGVISGTPSGSGPYTFTVRALDTVGNFGTRIYTVNIGTVSLTVNPATLPVAIAGRAYSQTITATGGTAPYTFSISAGALPAGLTLNATTGVISGTPTSAGNAIFTVTALDINGNTGSRQYTLDPRPDPALDPDVIGLVSAQVAATQRFASAQMDNISRHLESLHGDFNPCSYNFGIAPPIDRAGQNPAYGYNPYAGDVTGADLAPPAARPLPGRRDCALDWATSMAAWTAGSFQFGSMTPSGLSNSNRFYSAGLTAGVDLRLNHNVIVGAAIGYGADRTDVGSDGTRSDAESYTAIVYASMRLYDPLFLDSSLGYGSLGFDNRRWVSGDSTIVSGNRKGSYWFGAATLSLELGRDGVKFAPYVGGNYMSAKLDGYNESGASSELLTFQQSTFSATSAVAGLRGSIDMPTAFGIVTPNARIEYRNTWLGAYDQSMYYTDLGPGVLSTIAQPGTRQGTTTAALGLRARTPGGLTAEVEYGVSGGTGSLLAQTLRAQLRLPF